MELKTYFAQDAAGNIISSAVVNVFLQGTTTLATGLTRADGTPLENPFAADGAGRIQFRAPDGYYDVQVSAGSGIIQTLTIQCVDYSGAKADADRAEAAATRAESSAEQASDVVDAFITFGGELTPVPELTAVPKHSNPDIGDELDAQAQALLNRTEKLNDRVNKRAVSLYDHNGMPGEDCTDAILSALDATPGAVLVPAGDWVSTPTLENVHKVLAALSRLQVDGNLRISVPDGTSNGNATALCNLSGVGSVSVVGATTPARRSIVGFISATGSAGAWDVVLQLDSVEGVAVDGFLHTTDVTGTGATAIHRGCWPVLSINATANQVTVRNNCWKAVFPTHTITNSNTYPINAVLKFNNSDGFFVRRGQLFLDKLIVRGNAEDYWSASNVTGTEKGTHGLYAGGPTVAVNGKVDNVNPYGLSGGSISLGRMVGVYDFDQQGIVTELGGWVYGDFVSSCFNRRRGFYASTGSGIRAKHVSANGNYLDGLISDISGAIYASSSSCACGNGATGATSSSAGVVVVDSIIAKANGTNGLMAVSNGMLQATSAKVGSNGGHGFYAEYGGTIYSNGSSSTGNSQTGCYAGGGGYIRGLDMVINDNVQQAFRADEGGYINAIGSTMSGNSADFSLRNGGQILLGSGMVGGGQTAETVSLRNLTTMKGTRIATTSGGDSFLVGFDTVGAGTYTYDYTFSGTTNGFYPAADNTKLLGRSSNRWSTVFAGTGTINTSDQREKTTPEQITDAVLDAWGDVQLICFQWLHAVREKGEDMARWHFGVIAQQVRDAFAAHGLDGTRYGLLCYDEWQETPEVLDEDGNVAVPAQQAGNRWGIRADQCLFLEAALQRRNHKVLIGRIEEMSAQIDALMAK